MRNSIRSMYTAGLAVFQILMLVGAALPVFRSLRPTH